MKSGNLNFLEPSGPLQACNGTALPLYGCETWSVTLRENRRVRAFEKGVLRKIIDLKREEMREEWRTLHSEELQDLCYPPNVIRV